MGSLKYLLVARILGPLTGPYDVMPVFPQSRQDATPNTSIK